MPHKEGQPTLMGFLGIPIVTKIAKMRSLGGPYIRFYDFCAVLSYLYTSGAVLGRAKRPKLNVLAILFSVPGSEVDNVNQLQDDAKNRLQKFKDDVGREPNTFNEFILFRELEKAIGLSLEESFKACTRGDKKAIKIANEQVSLAEAERVIKCFGLEGIGFGSCFPDLTEKMYRTSFENPDKDWWAKAAARGLVFSQKPEIITLESQEETVLKIVAAYTSEYYPELLDPLDLRGYLKE